MGYRVVCISRTEGALATEVANAVADALGFRVLDEEIVERAAIEAGVDKEVIADVERRQTALKKIVDRFGLIGPVVSPDLLMVRGDHASAGTVGVALPSLAGQRLAGEELRGLIRSAIDEIAASGNVVIVAHAASHSLAGREGVLRVMVTASAATRRDRLSESLEVDAKEAEQVVKKGESARAQYFKRFYGIDEELPTHYDLVVNTDTLGPADAAAAITALVTRTPARASS